ncbi:MULTISPECIES: hypothetical protein [unclassified Treponema]|uniref:hypothetical protein n=1 Tax=unclassified Treponema TaxID=2638727 RepID=UPI0020A2C1B4|nr:MULTISPECIES: hypothetical protein [unclassified Treponema]UTC67097.1 hypothetical protein E4O06_00010 [Treponema sp. OMZ 789]UTC69828.1 hypothetical protein E4O01_00010 [Treponema sp. OMZ 790]UTC72542.1 hypothetical protein E4O02_00010 [Treponema sp. OMZ 791]
MRKKLFLLVGILFVILAGCDQFLRDIEKDFEYWASTIIVTDTAIPYAGIDSEGYPCLSSENDKLITIKIVNALKYEFKMPTDPGAPADIITFGSGVIGSGAGTPPPPLVQHGLYPYSKWCRPT